MSVLAPEAAKATDGALLCVRNAAHGRALGLCVWQAVSAMADARSLHCDSPKLRAGAATLRLKGSDTSTELGDVLEMLEHGPRDAQQAACLSAFAAYGLLVALTELPRAERAAEAARGVARLDWIELATEQRMIPYLGPLLAEAERGVASEWRYALFQAVLRDDDTSSGVQATKRARNALRMSALALVPGEETTLLLRSLRDCARDPGLRALALGLLSERAGKDAAVGSSVRVAGVARSPSCSLPVALLRWLSGFALLQALQRLACALVALRREIEVELREDALWVRWHTSFLGQTIRSQEACYELRRVTGAFRRARFALWRSAVSVLSLSLGVLLGGILLFDGARGGAPLLLWLGLGLIALGVAIDLALNVVWPARTARVDLQVELRGAPALRVGRVTQREADRLLEALSLRLSQGGSAEPR